MEPLALTPTTLRLAAAPAEESSGRVEYRFHDTGRAFDTGWRPDPTVTVSNLRSGATLNIVITVRDALSNTAPATAPFTLRLPSAPAGQPFSGGLWRSPAARASARIPAANWEWTEPPASVPASRGRHALWTDDRGRAAEPAVVTSGLAPRLDYRIQFPKPGRYFLRVRGWAVHDGNNRLAAGLNGELVPNDLVLPPSPDQTAWSNPLEITVERAGENVLHLWPRLDGALVETIAVSATDAVPADK